MKDTSEDTEIGCGGHFEVELHLPPPIDDNSSAALLLARSLGVVNGVRRKFT